MHTANPIAHAPLSSIQTNAATAPVQSNVWEYLEFHRPGLVVMSLLIVGCLGGAAAFFAMSMPVWVLGLCVCGATSTLSAAIGMASPKWIMGLMTVAVAIDIAVIVAGLVIS